MALFVVCVPPFHPRVYGTFAAEWDLWIVRMSRWGQRQYRAASDM